jgi:hypothetical protein
VRKWKKVNKREEKEEEGEYNGRRRRKVNETG